MRNVILPLSFLFFSSFTSIFYQQVNIGGLQYNKGNIGNQPSERYSKNGVFEIQTKPSIKVSINYRNLRDELPNKLANQIIISNIV
ncbi:MAG: hypothetical protein CVU14_07485 [Bacteroidetes bacterium HGW-Bacteroidetes-9]|jgi:hypothetical protein|nr:MAG: hypothetical protein CVU14_07485 [Bacteroidetes bacterium HGW-Bacteroidetes-9]